MSWWNKICHYNPECLKYIEPLAYRKSYYRDINIDYKVSFKKDGITLYIYILFEGIGEIPCLYSFNGVCKEGDLSALVDGEIGEIMDKHFTK